MNAIPGRIERVILASCLSPSGKWRLLLAEHIVSGMFCYDVLALNTQNNEVTCRHYRGIENAAYKAEAYRYYAKLKDDLASCKAPDEEPTEPYRVIYPD